MTRVLWLTTGLGRGGAERLLVDTAARLDHERYEVTIAYVLPWKHALVREACDAGASVTCLGTGRSSFDPRWIVRLARLLRAERYDMVHTHAPLPAAVARLLAPRRTAFVHTEHNLWARYRPLTRLANALTWRRNRHVFAVSDSVADSVGRTGPTVEVVVQGIDLARFSPGPHARARARRMLGIADDAVVVGTVGNLVAKKDHSTLVRAARELDRDFISSGRRAHVELVIVGSGPLAGEIRAEAATAGVAVHLLGMRSDVPDLLPGFDVFCLSSRFEGLPIAMLEAMASGVPVVASAVGGVPEVLTHGDDGLLVAAGDPAALAAAIGKVIDDAGLAAALGAAGRRRAAAFSLDRAVARTVAVYDEVAPSPSPSPGPLC